MSDMVSVVIPTFNASSFIAETLDSAFSQTFRDFEVIVVDDGSTDGTAEIVKKYQSQLPDGSPELIFISQPNGGPSSARNSGIKTAQGEFIAFLDADDLWLPESLAHMVSAMEEHPQCGLVFGDASSFGETGVLTASVFEKSGRPLLSDDGSVVEPFMALLEGNFILTGTVLMRKVCLLETGCFDESIRYAEDADVWLRAALLAPIALVPEVLLRRRIHHGNLSNVAINKKKKCDYFKIKIYHLNKLLDEYGDRFDWIHIVIIKNIIKTRKKRAYWYYLNRKYIKSAILYVNYYFIYFFRK